MFDLINVFEVFLPQLLRYPNPSDPLNGEAAALMMRDPRSYEAKVKGSCYWQGRARPHLMRLDYVRRFASGDADEKETDDKIESEVSSLAYSSDDEADQMEL